MKHLLIILSILLLTSPLFGQETGVLYQYKTSSGISKYLEGFTYGNGLFVTVGHLGNIYTSSDGTSWTKRTSGTSKYLRGVTYSQ